MGGGEGAPLRAIPDSIVVGEVAQRCEIAAGNFLESIPSACDAYLLKGVIHDGRTRMSVGNLPVRQAIRPGCTLLLVEGLVDSGRPGLMELLLLVIGGRERAETEFRALLADAGFALTRIVPADVSSILECRPA